MCQPPLSQWHLTLSLHGHDSTSLSHTHTHTHTLSRFVSRNHITYYVRTRQLGEGQFGYVYRRYHVFQGTNVAVKRTKPTPLDTRSGPIVTYEDVMDKCQEVRTLLRLRDDNDSSTSTRTKTGTGAQKNNGQEKQKQQRSMQLLEFFWNGEELNLVIELLGMNLREWLSVQESFTEDQARAAAQSILGAIQIMHDKHIVHRDIKEDNIMFRVPGDLTSLTICDFGFAQELVDYDEHGVQSRPTTTTGLCGSLGYIAPEIYAGESYGTTVDMFSFGVLLFRILSAEKPWPEEPSHISREATMQLQYRFDNKRQCWRMISERGKDLVRRHLTYSDDRITATQALRHPWFGERSNSILHADSSFCFPGSNARNTSRAIIDIVRG
jgi:serine/threonine protein kinase